MNEVYQAAKMSLDSDGFSAFRYLSAINSLLSNPVSTSLGRDLTIRALGARDKFTGHVGILRNMVRKAGLFPYLKKEFSEHSPSDRVALNLYRTPFSADFVFHSMQFQVFALLKAGRNVVLSAPTSMGKSAIVDSLLGLRSFKRVVLVVPTVALADETRRRLQERFGDTYQIIHHSSQKSHRDWVVYVLTQERVNERDDIEDIDIFVIDEFYKLAFRQLKKGITDFKDERVIELNIALSKLLKVSRQFYLTGPFVNSIRGLTELGYDHAFITADFNTVAVDVQTYGVDANDDEGKLKALAIIAPQCKGSTIIYCKSSGVAGKVARELVRLGYGQPFQDAHVEWVSKEFDPDWDYTYALKNGIGLHFGGLPRALQQYTADRFNAGDLRFLLCTSTIIEGVNTIAKNVVIYDNRNGNTGIDKFTHGNIKGRAGRMGVHFVGKVFCLEDVPEDNLNQEVDVPLGIQGADTPLNLLASAQPDHLSEYSQDRCEAAFAQDRFSIDLVKKHSYFRMEQFEQLYSMVEMLREEEFDSLVFHWSPAPGFLTALAKISSRLVPKAFSTNGLQTKTHDAILAKLTSYQKAESYSAYLKSQIEHTKQWSKVDEKVNLSTALNNDLKLVSNTFGYTIPKVLGLLEDVVRLHAIKKGIRSTIDYSYVRMSFENLHLPPGVNALEEIGIPIQTLHRMSKLLNFPEGASVDELADYLRQNERAWRSMGHVDQSFVRRALGAA
ncbi:TPA: DEAD/DEAH box helicase [Pseudomonas aeruginosa]|uniref:DEAD/DEAH box helicase n=1 Tax=Pseudomonas aeruginosa TaxID=287 RepID=UPI00048CD1BD|nr:DEAD/DEAH box helicase [Pseudomonas aeruginosa]MBH9347978.1 DEAD/DEAH box helicase [Pseudomonas aeruginosa]MCG0480615.1 DEAD/DEAH box helicase [Pseudomonas aeruginosa]MDA3400500.1 DEAD/DEAH box helicase [Pseudomonas aeruginosa]NQC86754.1 DEAD/DEAH box helicase [Pseudomonas aeruginosa]NQD34317.1 DEAD/DEAH box helicase [Pseudomonas aeruginosa]